MIAPVLVKLGGSVLTRKSEERHARPKVIDRLAGEIAEARERGSRALVLIHGAGSFGHPQARQHHLAEPPFDAASRAHRPRGAALTSISVRDLHRRVVRALLDHGVPALSLPPFPRTFNRAGELEATSREDFLRVLEADAVPVTFGDVVLDRDWGYSILSGDTLALALAPALGSPKAIFVSDVPGVWRPGAPGRRAVAPLLDEALLQSLNPLPGAPDVTGGIRRKVRVMLALARAGVPAGLVNGLERGRLLQALTGDESKGTWARPGVAENPRATDAGEPPRS